MTEVDEEPPRMTGGLEGKIGLCDIPSDDRSDETGDRST
jgi:hypothetical protein